MCYHNPSPPNQYMLKNLIRLLTTWLGSTFRWRKGVPNSPNSDKVCQQHFSMIVGESFSLKILHNKLARVLVNADIKTQIIDLMNTLNWNKLDQKWKHHLLLKWLSHVWRGMLLFIYLNFRWQLILIILGGRLLIWLSHLGKNSGNRTFHYRASKIWNNLLNDECNNYKSMTSHSIKEALTSL